MSSKPSPSLSIWLVLRSLLWTILLPGFFAGYVPWRYFGLNRVQLEVGNARQALGLFCIAFGAVLLGTCICEFARRGQGTLSPVDPPRHLVIRGLYRYVRNPTYLSVTIIVLAFVSACRLLGDLVLGRESVRHGLRITAGLATNGRDQRSDNRLEPARQVPVRSCRGGAGLIRRCQTARHRSGDGFKSPLGEDLPDQAT